MLFGACDVSDSTAALFKVGEGLINNRLRNFLVKIGDSHSDHGFYEASSADIISEVSCLLSGPDPH